ncbi:FHA domain-containing protein [Agarilytica rhodophyticola]|uniref:FHA domain-containing protein n=1 Tax=Agarilytica rhodophyticola TaxID=1737490 RepID=UPI000B341A5B|nr:FHA domain-containing protein [Agarilytica rhodophyticola]
MLKIQFKDKRKEPFWVMEKAFSIGRAGNSHLEIDEPSVSTQHAKILDKGETFLLKDLGSEAGTFVNGQRITQKNIVCGDTIAIGEVELVIIDPLEDINDQNSWSLIADSSWLSGQEFPIHGQADDILSVGRSSQCDIVFPGTHLSRVHAQITINYASLTIQDMSSANGTFINDKKVSIEQAYPGDRIRFDVYSFRVFGPGIKLPKSATTITREMPEEIVDKDKGNGTKKWKSKPTSPGNREELNLYKKQYRQHILAGIVIIALIATITYVALAITGNSLW